VRLLSCGEGAVLVELDDLETVVGLHAALREDPLPGVVELVPAARTLLVVYDRFLTDRHRLGRAVATVRPRSRHAGTGRQVEIDVRYDGEDLGEVARLVGRSEREVVDRHLAANYIVAFCGFAPGFAYLTGMDPALRVRRRDSPRTRVPAGSVAVADEFTGVYPRESPGGWRLLGRTDAKLWDQDRDPPALLPPGTRVRFREART
jgi:KipI family sensor histidine kinase inhibitor